MSLVKRTIAQHHVRIHLCRQMKKLRNGEPVNLHQGGVLQCSSAQDCDHNGRTLRKRLFCDSAHAIDSSARVQGWAAKRWFQAGAECQKSNRTALRNAGEFYIKRAMAMVTIHGDFGVSSFSRTPLLTFSVPLLGPL